MAKSVHLAVGSIFAPRWQISLSSSFVNVWPHGYSPGYFVRHWKFSHAQCSPGQLRTGNSGSQSTLSVAAPGYLQEAMVPGSFEGFSAVRQLLNWTWHTGPEGPGSSVCLGLYSDHTHCLFSSKFPHYLGLMEETQQRMK